MLSDCYCAAKKKNQKSAGAGWYKQFLIQSLILDLASVSSTCPTLGISCPPASSHCLLIISKMLFGASANIPSTILHFIKTFSIILAALSPCQVLFAGRLLSHVPLSAVSTIWALVSLYGSVSAVPCCKQQRQQQKSFQHPGQNIDTITEISDKQPWAFPPLIHSVFGK